MKVTVYSRNAASKLPPDSEKVLISISSPTKEYDYDVPSKGWKHFLPIEFDDFANEEHFIEWDNPKSVLFNRELGKKIIDTIKEYKPAEMIVHCDAGISRSVAIGAFIRDFFSYELVLTEWSDDRSKNQLVYNILRRIMMGIEDNG